MKNQKELSIEDIVTRLKWFHGEEFEKYPLEEEALKQFLATVKS